MRGIQQHIDNILYFENKIKNLPHHPDNVSDEVYATEVEVIRTLVQHIEFSKEICKTLQSTYNGTHTIQPSGLMLLLKELQGYANKWSLLLITNSRMHVYREAIIAVQDEVEDFLEKMLHKVVFVFPLMGCKNTKLPEYQ